MPLVDEGFASLTDIVSALASSDEVGCHVYIHSPRTRDRPYDWLRISMTNVVAQRLVVAANTSLLKIQDRAADEHCFAEFDFDAMAEGSIGILRSADVPAIADWLNDVPEDDWSIRFDGDERVLDRARYYVTSLNFADGRRLKLFRGSRGLSLTLRQRNMVAAMFQRDTLEMVPVEGPIISFDGKIDFFEWEGLIFITNLPTFESITNIREVTSRKASEAIDALGARFELVGLEGLKEEVGKRVRLAKKLAAAHQHSLFADMDPQRLLHRIEEKGLNVRCQIEEGITRFHVDGSNRDEVEDFVNLMTDFYLHSPVTRREWEAVVKRVPRERH